MSEKIETLIGPVIDALGYELVRVQMQGGARQPTLQIMAERRDRAAMLVDDCASLSRAISNLLDEADPIDSEYLLEVSSPGIDRPLMKRADYQRFAGHDAKIELDAPIGGRKRFQGPIGRIEGENVSIDCEGGAVTLPLAAIKSAKLILTDRLIAAVESEAAATAAIMEEAGAPPVHV